MIENEVRTEPSEGLSRPLHIGKLNAIHTTVSMPNCQVSNALAFKNVGDLLAGCGRSWIEPKALTIRQLQDRSHVRASRFDGTNGGI